jgi:hypothetical protein
MTHTDMTAAPSESSRCGRVMDVYKTATLQMRSLLTESGASWHAAKAVICRKSKVERCWYPERQSARSR